MLARNLVETEREMFLKLLGHGCTITATERRWYATWRNPHRPVHERARTINRRDR